jgi:flagellar hook-associated protein 1 FlgK
MGVNVDEEGINMMNYQKWYNAIARMTTTLDEALDRLITSTGRVGL